MDNRFNDIFCNPPNTWGLKGEPLLWEDLREYFQTRAFPQNEHAFVKEMYAAFEKLTGWPVETTSFIFISRYNRGGIAGGLIDPWNWRNVVIPALTRRFQVLRQVI